MGIGKCLKGKPQPERVAVFLWVEILKPMILFHLNFCNTNKKAALKKAARFKSLCINQILSFKVFGVGGGH
jgi:hypothetical protein